MFEYFFESSDTIVKGVGFSHFEGLHFAWLLFFVVFCGVSCYLYKNRSPEQRKKMRYLYAALLLLDEVIKIAGLAAFGNYDVSYLPLHLCSINIILIAVHVLKPSKTLDNFLYAICIPAAIAALLFPTWTKLPLLNFMHIHSFTVHILLATYPIMLTVGGDIRPTAKELPKSLLFLMGLALPVYVVNLLCDTNFMFLMKASKGNPLYWFEEAWGSHFLGFPVIMAGVILVMYFPHIVRFIKKKRSEKEIHV